MKITMRMQVSHYNYMALIDVFGLLSVAMFVYVFDLAFKHQKRKYKQPVKTNEFFANLFTYRPITFPEAHLTILLIFTFLLMPFMQLFSNREWAKWKQFAEENR